MTEPPVRPRRRILPPVWLLFAIVLAVGLDRLLPLADFPGLPAYLAGGAAVALGLAMIVVPAGAFARAGTEIVPFRPSTTLVTGGFYKLTRNPMYLGMVLVLAGIGLLLGSAGALLPLPLFAVIIDRRFIAGEEQMLQATFGNEYRDYCQTVRRWL
ncbi:MAG: isoprenylcysteine carboxylmethyltransferase family protein [Pseudomonadota bacterium]